MNLLEIYIIIYIFYQKIAFKYNTKLKIHKLIIYS